MVLSDDKVMMDGSEVVFVAILVSISCNSVSGELTADAANEKANAPVMPETMAMAIIMP
jgi:hypothetical protein